MLAIQFSKTFPSLLVMRRDVYIPVDYMTRLPRGIAFLEFTEPKDAEDAIYGLDRKVFDGREVSTQRTHAYQTCSSMSGMHEAGSA